MDSKSLEYAPDLFQASGHEVPVCIAYAINVNSCFCMPDAWALKYWFNWVVWADHAVYYDAFFFLSSFGLLSL
jgi:hypothetical protein